MIKFECETCFQEYKVRDERAGQVLKCKSCGHKMRVPAGEDDLLDDMYDDFEAPARPARNKKSSGASKSASKRKNSNAPVGIIVGVISFAVAFYLSSTFVSGLFGKKNKEEAADPPAIVQNEAENSLTTSDANPAASTSPQQTSTEANSFGPPPLTPKERSAELTRLREQMKVYAEAIKTATPEDRKDLLAKMKTTLARVKELTGKDETKTAATAGTSTPAKPAQVNSQKWTSLVDAPPVVAEWPESSKLKIDLKNMEEELITPNSFSPFVGIRQRNHKFYRIDVWNLALEEKVGQITITPEKNWIVLTPKFKLSADGKHLLLQYITRDTKVPMLACWDTTTGEIVAEWEADQANTTVSLYEICGLTSAFAKIIRKEGTKYKTILKHWDLVTGKLLKESEVKSNEFYDTGYKISPGGKYLISHTSNKMFFYDLESLKLIYQTELDLFLKSNEQYPSLETVDFSADGTELGLLVTSSDSTSVWVTNLEKGTATQGYHTSGRLRTVFSEPSYSGNNLELTPSGKSFLLYGALLVDRPSQRNVWLFQPVPRVTIRSKLFLTPHYLLAGTDSALTDERNRLRLNRKPRLVSVPLPEQKIIDSLAAYRSNNDAILGSAQKVSIDVNIGSVKFSNADQVKSILKEVIQERLEAEGFEIAEDQPIVFKMEYQEQEGNKLQMTKRGRPTPGNPLGRTATGKTLQSTAAAFKLSWVSNSPKRTLWSKQALVNPRFLILRDATAEEARESMFEGLQNRLMAESIPYFIPKQKTLSMLPGETQLPE
ncbi:hypothetical protein Pan241w_45620 [Gimesia alba]|uniref:Zinc finger/thioredoxin putative domain-containing protein n=1 Tax=Gimesia alba TaxID=2527973 RepID=A0A517RKN4_9PLAN|nr:hypothetical protein [Gimesia alba]QDT44453.1 hypothetical protein Pan241w_45620 [Gimesia alba]